MVYSGSCDLLKTEKTGEEVMPAIGIIPVMSLENDQEE